MKLDERDIQLIAKVIAENLDQPLSRLHSLQPMMQLDAMKPNQK
jgi:hypothetical protein